MKEELQRLYMALLGAVARGAGVWRDSRLTAFAAVKGERYRGDLMVVGRAANGLDPCWRAHEVLDEALRRQIVRETFDRFTRSACPMIWVSEFWGVERAYNTRRSAFWRVIRATLVELGLVDAEDRSWPSLLAWSNLYKVSPCQWGNPSSRLCSVQDDLCRQILREEIAAWKPRRILFLTGKDWADPFLGPLSFHQDETISCSAVEAVGSASGRARIVVAPHPQGKEEAPIVKGTSAAFSHVGAR